MNYLKKFLAVLLSLVMISTSVAVFAAEWTDQARKVQQTDTAEFAENVASAVLGSKEIKTENESTPADKTGLKELVAVSDRYEVTVSFDASAGIPDEARLVLTEYEDNDEEFIAAREALVADKNGNSVFSQTSEEDQSNLGMAAFDLTIYDKYGNEIEPKSEVKVSFKLKDISEGKDTEEIACSMEIQHLNECSGDVVVEKIATYNIIEANLNEAIGKIETNIKESTINAETVVNSFSTYTVTWETGNQTSTVVLHFVDDKGNDLGNGFTYNGQPVDNGSTSLADLIPQNGLFDLGQITKEGYSLSNVHIGQFADMNGNTPTIIRNEVERANNTLRYWTFNTGSDTANVTRNDFPAGTTNLYLVYNSTSMAGQGSGGSGSGETPDLADLGHKKEAKSNEDGTYKLFLSVTGSAQNQETDPHVNVIVVFDTSSSMVSHYIPDSSSMTRLEAAKVQVNELAGELLALNTPEHPDAVEMALVTFNRNANIEEMNGGYWTKSASTYTSVVGTYTNGPLTNNNEGTAGAGNTGINTAKGTNWAQGIQKAIDLMQDSSTDDDPTYVLFITDGAPSVYWPSGQATGTYVDAEGCCLGARDEARRLVGGEGAILYALFTYGSTEDYGKDYLGKLVDYAYNNPSAKNDYRFNVADNQTFKQKLKAILGIISMNFAYANVSIDDGVTGLSTVVFERIATDSFEYSITYRNYSSTTEFTEETVIPTVNGDGSVTIPARTYTVLDKDSSTGLRTITTEEVTVTGAQYSDTSKSVVWDMKKVVSGNESNLYLLEEAWTYTVTFDIWPSQASYDLVAALNNGILKYGDDYHYTDENGNTVTVPFTDYKSQVTDTRPYTLLTNTHFTIKYQQVTETINPDGTTSYELGPVKPIEDPYTYKMPLESQLMPVIKKFAHSINAQDPYTKVRFYIIVDGKYYQSDGTLSETLVPYTDDETVHTIYMDLHEGNSWTGNIYIAPGVIKDERPGGQMLVLESGHDYCLEEEVLEGPVYEYEFTPQTLRPMVVNGTLKYLIKEDKYNKPSASATVYEINGVNYFEAPANAQMLTGTNRKTAELDITKIVKDPDSLLTEEQENKESFTYRVTLMIPDGTDPAGIVGYEYVPRVQDNAFLLYGYQETDEGQGFSEDVERFSGETYRAWNTLVYRDLIEWETDSSGKVKAKTDKNGNIIWKIPAVDGYHTVTYDMTLKQDEVIRFTNLPSGTKYVIQEIYANKYPADNVGGQTSGRAPVDDPSNLEDQGYTITRIQSVGVNEGTAEINEAGDTISGEISSLDTRYYNQFTNTISAIVDAELKVTKHIDGYKWAGERYYFDLSGESDATPLPGGNGGRTALYTKAASGDADVTQSFGRVRFSAPGEYTYFIEERTPTTPVEGGKAQESDRRPGVVYDTSKKKVVVVVKAKDKGLYIDSITGEDGAEYLSTDLEAEPATATVTVTNTYKATGTAILEAVKAVTGMAWPEGKTITLTLSGTGGTLPTTKTVTLIEPGKATFGAITYDESDAGKTYEYTISEDGFGAGWTGSGNVVAKVEVIDNGDGTLNPVVTYTPSNDTITNTYKASGSIELEANKTLVGRDWKENETYTFTLYGPDGNEIESKTVTKNGTISFSALEFDQNDLKDPDGGYLTEKELTYTISETTDPLPKGVTKSGDIEATVTIKDNKNGELNVTAEYSSEDTIINTYEAKPVEVVLNVNKTLKGYIKGVENVFTFELIDADGKVIQTKQITASNIEGDTATGTVSFDKIEYKTKGEYKYQVKETKGDKAGMTYDTTVYDVLIEVTDNLEGALEASVTSGGEKKTDFGFLNKFGQESIDVEMTVIKNIVDESNSAKDGEFTFQLREKESGEVVEEVKIATKEFTGEAKFKKINYTEAGTYEYVLQEIAPTTGTEGWTYDTKEYPVVVTVSNNITTAKLEATATIDGAETTSLTVINTYKAAETKLVLSVVKEINDTADPEYSGDYNKAEFTFTLSGTEVPMPAGGGNKVTVVGEGEGKFGEITYDKIGTYEYKITETEGSAAGFDYDTTEYPVTVTVVDEGGKLVATPVYGSGEGSTTLTVTNTYSAEGEAVIKGNKVVDDKSGSAPAEEFTFVLKQAGEVVETVKSKAGPFSFKKLSYTKVGTYTYTVEETAGETKGFTYDKTVYEVTVKVTDPNKNGLLVTEVSYGEGKTSAEFTNPYEATPTEATFKVTKVLEGDAEYLSEEVLPEFTFVLTEGDKVIESVKVKGEGESEFKAIAFTKVGEYNYTIYENTGDEDGFTYDTTKHQVKVTVSDEGGALKAAATVDGEATDTVEVEFVNSFEFTPVTYDPPVKKVLTGDTPPKDETFEFVMEAVTEGAPMPEGTEEDGTKTVSVTGEGETEFGDMTYTAPGTYEYTIYEVAGKAARYTYDTATYTLTVDVTVEGTELVLTTTYVKNVEEPEMAEEAVFVNRYEKEVPPPTDATRETRVWTGFSLVTMLTAAGLMIIRRRREEE